MDEDTTPKRVYYSQNREDLILESFFGDVEKGFYVDVGAYHPDHDSVTKRFYLNGWRGINVEPQPDQYKLFEKHRKRDINLNVGISDKKGKATLRTYPNKGLSTFSAELKQSYKKSGPERTGTFRDISVNITTLADVLERHKIKEIQFLKVDVEGREYEALKGNDWKKFRPEVLCVEANHRDKDWSSLLLQQDYKLVFFDGLNEYYTDNKNDRSKKFRFIEHILIELHGGIKAEDYERILKLEQSNAKYAGLVENYQKNLDGLNAKIRDMEREVNVAKANHKTRRNPVRKAKRLFKRKG